MKNMLVTGGAGFIGSNFIKYILSKYSKYTIINVDKLTYAGNLENLIEVENNNNYIFIKADISDKEAINKIFIEHDIDYIVNFAAESHVDRSIEDPTVFLNTNVLGTQVLLDVAKKYWKIYPDDKYSLEYKSGVKFLQVSTDEVYGALGKSGMFTENTLIAPNSPYSAAKASADLFVRAYNKTYGLPVNITRCSNNYGPYQFPEKLIPLMINNCKKNLEMPVYGDGMHIRDWLHVNDHCSALDTVLHKGENGQVYNIGGNNEKSNIDIVNLIIKSLGRSGELIRYVPDRLGHDRRYSIDNTKITTELEWSPKYSFEDGIEETIKWYLNNEKWLNNVTSGKYLNYYNNMYKF